MIDLSGSDVPRAFAIYDKSRQFMKDLEHKRAKVFSQRVEDDGSTSCSMVLERPDENELNTLIESYLETLPDEERKFVEDTDLAPNIGLAFEKFFGYEAKYRYVTFYLANDGTTFLPNVMVIESDKLYDSDKASQGTLDVPMSEVSVKEWVDLKVGDPTLERYSRFFSVESQ